MGNTWKEVSRREVGVVTSDTGRAGATFTLLCLVTESRMVGHAPEWRERVVPGKTLYQARQVVLGTSALLEVVAKGVKALSSIARAEDDRATSRRKRR